MAAQRDHEGADPKTVYPWPPMPQAIRNYLSPRDCRATTFEALERALLHLYRTDLLVRYRVPWATFQSLIISGRGAVIQIDYSAVHGTRFDACPSFTGRHAVYANERRASDGAFLVYDPLADGRRKGIPQGPQWWPALLLKRAAAGFPGVAFGQINAAFTRDTE